MFSLLSLTHNLVLNENNCQNSWGVSENTNVLWIMMQRLQSALSASVCMRLYVCACRVWHQRVYKEKCDLCGAVISWQVEKDPVIWEPKENAKDPPKRILSFEPSGWVLLCFAAQSHTWTVLYMKILFNLFHLSGFILLYVARFKL